jgi:hypothetical protein
MADHPLALMRLHVAALFTQDARDRLVSVNQPAGGPAPRFFLGRTADGAVSFVRNDVDADLAGALETMVRGDPPTLPTGPEPERTSGRPGKSCS